jgi:hypothetical protein
MPVYGSMSSGKKAAGVRIETPRGTPPMSSSKEQSRVRRAMKLGLWSFVVYLYL